MQDFYIDLTTDNNLVASIAARSVKSTLHRTKVRGVVPSLASMFCNFMQTKPCPFIAKLTGFLRTHRAVPFPKERKNEKINQPLERC